MKKYKYLLCILSCLTLFTLIQINKYDELNKFKKNFVLTTQVNDNQNSIPVANAYQEEITDLQIKYNNDDIKATLEFVNTDYKVPVVQGKDNNFYLRRLPNKEYNIMGSIFLDYRVNVNTSKKMLIYGHNDARFQMPFYILENYYDKEYLDNHKYVVIKTREKIRTYEIFSVFIETSDFSYMKVNFENDNYLDHLNMLKNKSMFKIESELTSDTNILLLQTCSTHTDYANYKKKYLILAFKEVNNIEQEKVD